MYIRELAFEKVRNHIKSLLGFTSGVNIFVGKNGAGKTTILECISISSLSKSFLHVNDASLIKMGENYYSISCFATSDLKIPYNIKISYEKGKRKNISSTLGDNLSPKDIIGEIPIVIIAPELKSLTAGMPNERRRFMDRLLSQIWKSYLEDLLILKKCIKQRNNLLSTYKFHNQIDEELYDSWTEIFIKTSSQIIEKRIKFANDFVDFFIKTYKFLSDGKEAVEIEYIPFGINEVAINTSINKNEITDFYKAIFKKYKELELSRGVTLFGPQKDDLKIKINGGNAKEFASQGQHKSLQISIKLAEFNYLKSIKSETPILLLDDVFSELDLERCDKVKELILNNQCQTFITTTDMDAVKNRMEGINNFRYFEVEDGKLKVVQ